MAKGEITRIYKDIDMAFTANAVSLDVNKKIDVNAVKQSIKNLLLTKKYDRKFNPTIESPVYRMLFENSMVVRPMVERQIEEILEAYEPRALNERVKLTENIDNLYWKIDIFYRVVGVNEPTQLSVILDRIR